MKTTRQLQKEFVEYCGGIYDPEKNLQGGFESGQLYSVLGFKEFSVVFRRNKHRGLYMYIHQVTSVNKRKGSLSAMMKKVLTFTKVRNIEIELQDCSMCLNGFDVWSHYGFDGKYHSDRRVLRMPIKVGA